MPIGNASEAAEILAAFRKGRSEDKWDEGIAIPDGWKYLGHGLYRTAFLSPSGVVYKLERGSLSWWENNRKEYENILEMRYDSRVTETVIIPKAWLYEIDGSDVIAMEFMDGIWTEFHFPEDCECGDTFGGTCARVQFRAIEQKLALNDVHSGNAVFIPAQKKWALIDLGG